MNKAFLIALVLSISLILFACTKKTTETPTPSPTPTQTSIPRAICPLCFADLSTPQSQPTPVIYLISKDGQSYLLVEDKRRQELVATESSRVENCLGPSGITQSFTRSRTFTSSVEIGASTEAGIEEFIKLSIATHYQMNLGVTETVETNVGFVAPTGLTMIYTVEWYEEWSEGRIMPISNLQAGEMLAIPYRAKKGLVYVIKPTPEACLVTATVEPLPTLTSTIVPTETLLVQPTMELPPTSTLEATLTPTP